MCEQDLIDLPDSFKKLTTRKLGPKQPKGLVTMLNDLILYKPRGYENIIKEALDGEYSDFENEKYDAPLTALMSQVGHIQTMRGRIKNGTYDHSYVLLEGDTLQEKEKGLEKEFETMLQHMFGVKR